MEARRSLPPLGWGVLWRLAIAPLPSLLWPIGRWELQATYNTSLLDVALHGLDKLAVAGPLIVLATLLFGVPLYALYWLRDWSAPWTFAIGGALIPTLLFQILPELLIQKSPGSDFSFYEQGCDAIVHSVRTTCGYRILAAGMLEDALLGGVAGLIFWALLRPLARSIE